MSRTFDHIVLASHDLEAQGRFFERLGFTVGAVNRHPWGTLNRIIQLDGAFLELITTGPDFRAPQDLPAEQFSFAGFIARYLSWREGAAMLAYATSNAVADRRLFHACGIGDYETFHFERRGKRPDGGSVQVAFTLAFAADPLAPMAGFFTCQNHFPENFWNASFQNHPNGAKGLSGVLMTAEAPADHARFLSQLTGCHDFRASSLGVFYDDKASGQCLSVITPRASEQMFGAQGLPSSGNSMLAGIRIRGCDLDALVARLSGQGIENTRREGFIIVPHEQAFGAAIVFE
ncbi:MAG: VOC family protein [Alphaproteobacteria bacterium]|nr:VOC family protein [Alphaproteobacteria bacterium]